MCSFIKHVIDATLKGFLLLITHVQRHGTHLIDEFQKTIDRMVNFRMVLISSHQGSLMFPFSFCYLILSMLT